MCMPLAEVESLLANVNEMHEKKIMRIAYGALERSDGLQDQGFGVGDRGYRTVCGPATPDRFLRVMAQEAVFISPRSKALHGYVTATDLGADKVLIHSAVPGGCRGSLEISG
jgi:hypothetical protein